MIGTKWGRRAYSVAVKEQCFHRVAVIGAPNAGKSTLLNRLIGAKVSIVSPKAQTTREQTIGVMTHNHSQTAFLDTPGVLPFGPDQKRIPGLLSKESWQSAAEADSVMVVVDAARGMCDEVRFIMDQLNSEQLSGLLVLNKADLLKGMQRERLLILAEELYDSEIFRHCFMVSALKGSQVDLLKEELCQAAAADTPWQFKPDQISTAAMEKTISEAVREQIYRRMHQELPYNCEIRVLHAKKTKSGKLIDTSVEIMVRQKRHQMMIVGTGGSVVKQIRQQARKDLMRIFGLDVMLHVGVRITNHG